MESEILADLESNNSRLYKENVLEQNKDNDELKLVLKAALDPYTQYYQRKIPEYSRKEDQPTKSLLWGLEGLKTLTSREYTGNAAIEQLQRILSSLTEENAGKILSNVNKKLDYLVIGEKPTTKKVRQAKELNIKVIEQSEWEKLLN